MKRISTLLVAAAMFFGSIGAAQAVEVKVKGTFDFVYGWGTNIGFNRDQSTRNGDEREDFIAKQRVRTQVNFITSEFLQGVLMFEIGNITWGRNGGKNGQGSGGDLGADGVNIETKRAYLDWLVPGTDLAIRMGIQGLALPSATGFGSPIFDDDVAAITASYKFNDMFALTAFWARMYDAYDSYGGNERHLSDDADMWGVIAPITGDGWALTPWGVVANVGSHSGMIEKMYGATSDDQFYTDYVGSTVRNPNRGGNTDSSLVWLVGTGFELTMFDPLTFAMDVMYGRMAGIENAYGVNFDDKISTRGWFIDARLDYKMDWATAGIFGWWSSGDGADAFKDGKLGRIPSFSTSAGFGPTTFGADGGFGISDCDAVFETGIGTWGIGAQLADMSFIEDLKHTLRVAYYRGTNHKDNAQKRDFLPLESPLKYSSDTIYMTTADHAWEVNFDSTYQIYENLAAVVELGYIHLNLDEKHFQYEDRQNAWKAQVSFRYEF